MRTAVLTTFLNYEINKVSVVELDNRINCKEGSESTRIRIHFGRLDPDPIRTQEGKNNPQKS